MTKHVSKAGKVDPGDRVTLPVKFACKPELKFNPLVTVTLSPCKQTLTLTHFVSHTEYKCRPFARWSHFTTTNRTLPGIDGFQCHAIQKRSK